MAYYSSGFYSDEAGDGEYFQTTPFYATNYDIVPFQDSQSYSSYEFGEPDHLAYGSNLQSSNPYYGGDFAYNPFVARSELHYSSYNPIPYATSHFSYQTDYVVSYNTVAALEDDDTEFEEYDSTPYGGGYDQTLTYGRPLPPSDEICYRRSLPGPNSLPQDNLSLNSLPSPYGKDLVADDSLSKPPNGSKPSKPIQEGGEGEEKKINGGSGDNTSDSSQEEQRGVSSTSDDHDHGHQPWSGYDYGNGGIWNGGYGYNGYRYPIPYGYGLEAMDLCESLFGYFPCLRKYNGKRNGCQEGELEESQAQERDWKRCADYLFGGPCRHGDGGGAGYYGEPTCNYNERHYQEQSYTQVEGGEEPWMQNFKMY
ncbi:hypothetical protein NMG60_11022374 [Bertholletia excelsa]